MPLFQGVTLLLPLPSPRINLTAPRLLLSRFYPPLHSLYPYLCLSPPPLYYFFGNVRIVATPTGTKLDFEGKNSNTSSGEVVGKMSVKLPVSSSSALLSVCSPLSPPLLSFHPHLYLSVVPSFDLLSLPQKLLTALTCSVPLSSPRPSPRLPFLMRPQSYSALAAGAAPISSPK